ncbi:MAG: outer membrane beta-barrel protein [Vicinamibacteria bacterium]
MNRRLTLLALFGLAAPAVHAADEPRLTVSAYGVFAPPSVDYTTARTFDAFAEEGRIDTDYEAGKGPGGELGLTYRFARRLGVSLAGSTVSRDTTATYSVSVPHPLFLNRPRTAEGTVDVDYSEKAGHLDLVYLAGSGSLDLALFAGPSFVSVSADLLGEPVYSQAYPFDEITVTSVQPSAADKSGIGFNVGAAVTYRFSKSVGFGVQGRFTRASLELERDGGDPVSIDAGGLQVGAGFRFSF